MNQQVSQISGKTMVAACNGRQVFPKSAGAFRHGKIVCLCFLKNGFVFFFAQKVIHTKKPPYKCVGRINVRINFLGIAVGKFHEKFFIKIGVMGFVGNACPERVILTSFCRIVCQYKFVLIVADRLIDKEFAVLR